MFITSVKNNIDRFVAIILVILMALMVINVSWQVASRYIFQNPSAFTDELARYVDLGGDAWGSLCGWKR